MSDCLDVDRYVFLLDGREKLGARYDEFADVLYLWRGEAPACAISLRSDEGHLVRIDPDSGALVGFTIFGCEGELKHQGPIRVTVPVVGRDDDDPRPSKPTTHELELVGA